MGRRGDRRRVDLARGAQINSLHIDRRDLSTILQLDNPIVSLIAADRSVRVNGLRDFQLRRLAALDQIENERCSPDFHRRSPLAHVRVAEDDVKPPITARVHMRLVTGINQRAVIHRVNAHQHAEKIRALRDLINAWLP